MSINSTTVSAPAQKPAHMYQLIAAASIGNALEWFRPPHLRLFCRHHLAPLLSCRERNRVVADGAGNFWYFVSGAAGRGYFPGSLCRPGRAQSVAAGFNRLDDGRHLPDADHAQLCLYRHSGAHQCASGAPDARLFGRWRVRQRYRIPGGTRLREKGIFRELAMGQPGIGRADSIGLRSGPDYAPDKAATRVLGLAHALSVRPADRARGPLHPAPCNRNAGIPCASSPPARQCATC